MKSLFFLLFICTLYLPVNARSLSQPPKGPGEPEPVCLVWNRRKETPPEEKAVNFKTHFCAVILKKDDSGEWQLSRLDITKKFGRATTNSLCFLIGNSYNYLCVGDRCSTTGPLKENAKGSDDEIQKEQECLNEIKNALEKSLPLLYPTDPSPIARSLLCLDGSPPYARQLSESHSHCVVHIALDPVRESCEVIKYSAVKEPNQNPANNTCISEDGHAICHCDSPQCNWELEKFHPALTSLGQSLRSRALSTCKPKPQCAVMKENTKAVQFKDRKETGICFIEYSSDGTVKRMGRQELQEKTPTTVDRMCQVRDRNGFICFCKGHKCVAEFVSNNTPMYDGNWHLLKRTEKYPKKLRVRQCGDTNVWTYDPENKQICTKVFAQKGQACSVSYKFVGSGTKRQCVAGKSKSAHYVHCACQTEKCPNKELEKHLREVKKQIDPSGKDCLIDIEQRTTVSTTAKPPPAVPRNTDALIEDEVGTTTVSIHRSTTGQGEEKATTSTTGSTTQGQKTDDDIQSSSGNGEDVAQTTDPNENATSNSDSTPVSTSEEPTPDGKSVTSPPVQKTTRASNPSSKDQGGKAEDEKRKETEKAGGFPNWAIYLIVGLVILGILTYIIAVVKKWRKEKKEEAERERIRQSMPWNQEVVKKTNNEPLPPRRQTLRQMLEEEALAREKKRVRRIELIKANQATRPDVFSDRRFQKMGPLKFSHIPKNLPSDPLTSSRSLKDDAPVEYDDSKNMIYLMGSSVEVIDDTVEATQPSERADDPKSLAVERTQPSERVGGDVSGPKKETKKKHEKGGKGKEVSKKDGKEPGKEGGAECKTPEEMV